MLFRSVSGLGERPEAGARFGEGSGHGGLPAIINLRSLSTDSVQVQIVVRSSHAEASCAHGHFWLLTFAQRIYAGKHRAFQKFQARPATRAHECDLSS